MQINYRAVIHWFHEMLVGFRSDVGGFRSQWF